jgi:excisionase family DNA binding protein
MAKEYVTTFQAAELLSVTPDSVLKWIKSGKLEARRTPGGHHRIARKSIEALLVRNQKISRFGHNQPVFQYCWEYNAEQRNCSDRCEDCVVYKTSAKRCYKMCDFPRELGHLRQFCTTSCENCEYYKIAKANN